MTTETLSGIPSIIYGLFGYLFFVVQLKLKYSVLSGTLTLAIMILPLIIRTTEEALKSVPDSYREGSFGLGAGKLRTVFKIVLPPAVPGILSGVILATGRIVAKRQRCCIQPERAQKPHGTFLNQDVLYQNTCIFYQVKDYTSISRTQQQ